MVKDNQILLGKASDKEVYIYPKMLNRHGLIAGATGTGKTVTLKVIAESLSELGIPTVISDVKGDLTGMIEAGEKSNISERLDSMGITDFDTRKYPVHFFDVYQKEGHPIRATVQSMGPLLLSRILDCTDAQQGILNIIFRVARDMDLDLIDLKDLQAMTSYVGEHAKDFTLKYGNITKQSVGAIQRKLLELEEQGGDIFFGMPALSIDDWITTEGGLGMMNIIECDTLFEHPLLYATFLEWMLEELYDNLPEVGDLDKPKIVFFFDEAHLLFSNAPKQLMDQIEKTVKLIRSKGVGIFFITQNPADIPDAVLAQLSTRIQHALRAYTPKEIKAAKMAADSFRVNPEFDTAEKITQLKTGYALVSALTTDGAPTIVEETKILPPKSTLGAISKDKVQRSIETDSIYGKYEKSYDPESAYEEIDVIRKDEAQALEDEKKAKEQQKLDAIKAREEAKAAAKKANEKTWVNRMQRKATNKVENELMNMGVRQAKKFLKGFFK